MDLFQHEQIRSMNESELSVYNYVSSNLPEAERMNIRELSAATNVSTTTVLRFCKKIGCNGYTEFKYRLRKILEEEKSSRAYLPSTMPALQYLQKMMSASDFDAQIEESARLCMGASQVLFAGIGTSGILGEYGMRFFSGVGITSFAITDPFCPPPMKLMEDTVLIALSVSGETPWVISIVNGYKKRGVKIISITNTSHCTLAKMSEINFAYYMPLAYAWQEIGEINLTTQLPVVYLLETLMSRLYLKQKEKK